MELTVEKYQRANRRMKQREEKKGFIIHGIVYLGVNALLITANLVFVPEFLWFFFPLAGWGIGLAMHYLFGVIRLPGILENEERRVADEARRM